MEQQNDHDRDKSLNLLLSETDSFPAEGHVN